LTTNEMQPVVKVVIKAHELAHITAEQESMYVAARLRAARVPVLGMFEFKGVEYGKIVSYTDIETGDKVILWRDN